MQSVAGAAKMLRLFVSSCAGRYMTLRDGMDITSELMNGTYPSLSRIYYDSIRREAVLMAVNNPEGMIDVRVVTFPDIVKYSEEIENLDDDLIHGVISIHWMSNNQFCIKADIREIIIILTGNYYGKTIT
ncbi:hypothetical protein ACJJIG_18105 [Microbulbifer sp. SSSA007]|uniref:hypothetical protein n=1 Tax=Microbulbifer sp. SSSA007 TaxID=3243379 RepID=UPI004039E185